MTIHIDADDPAFLHLLTRELRQILALGRLTPEQRRRWKGSWFLNAGEFAERAALAREAHADLLDDLPFRGGDITARRLRVARLEDALVILTQLTKDVADTLIKERAELFSMTTFVLRCLEDILNHPYKALAHKIPLAGTVRWLRREFDRRNERISKGRQPQAPVAALPAAENS